MSSETPQNIEIVVSEEPPAKRVKIDQPTGKVIGISEGDVGITEYISPEIPGFKGILKQRYTDFLVNEIDLQGKVIRLVDLGPRGKRDRRRERREKERNDNEESAAEPKTEEPAEPKSEEPAEVKPKVSHPPLDDAHREKLLQIIGSDTLDRILELFHTGSKLETPEQLESKDQRTQLHQLLREAFDSRLETKTTPENRFIITLATRSARNRNIRLDKSTMGTPQDFLHFVIYKENKETMEVANLISKFLRIPPKSVSYAGTKDRRGVTVQQASVTKMSVERLCGLNKALRGIKLGSFKFAAERLTLGDLNGNEFYITLRDVEPLEGGSTDNLTATIESALASLRDNGFINYFGMQRFGTFSISTNTIGKFVLNEDWKRVVDLILSPQDLVLPESVEARKIWAETGDAGKALAAMPRKCVAEHAILRTLAQEPKSFLNAVMQIPRNLRIMYAHAYQSYVWNLVASERLRRYGFQLVKGDLIIDEASPAKGDPAAAAEDTADDVEETYVRARVVTDAELESSSKTIFDLVLPTPGFDVIYPENDLREVYETTMKGDGVDMYKMRRNIKEFSLSGNYRNVVSRPKEVKWWFKNYSSATDQFVKTDLELLSENDGKDVPETAERISEDVAEGPLRAVVVKIQLGTSQYATMALREVMKLDSSRRGDGLDVNTATA